MSDEVIATAAAALVREDRLREAILDIAAHATAINDSHESDEWIDGFYVVTIGSIHRALGVIGHSSVRASNAPLAISCQHLGAVQPYAEVFRTFEGKWLWESLCKECFSGAAEEGE